MEATYLSGFGAYVKMNIAGEDVSAGELRQFQASYSYWTQAPMLEFGIITSNHKLIEACKATGATVKLEYGSTDEQGIPVDKKVTRWAILDHQSDENQGQSKETRIKVWCTVDALKYFNMAQIDGSKEPLTIVQAMKKLPCFGSGAEGSNTLKLQVEDDLEQRGGDKQKWLQSESVCNEYLNTLLKHSYIKDNPTGGKEWIYFPVINFDEKGTPVFRLTDLKLRCQHFGPTQIKFPDGKSRPAKFTYGDNEERWTYYKCEPDVRGVGYYSQFWKRATLSVDQGHSTTSYKEVVELMLFPDSISVEDEEKASYGESPSQALFQGNNRANTYFYNDNDYSKQYGPQRFQVATCLGFLRRVNMRVSASNHCFLLQPGDVVNIEVGRPSKEDNTELLERNPHLSTNYCVTEVYHSYAEGILATHFVASRDSLSKEGMS